MPENIEIQGLLPHQGAMQLIESVSSWTRDDIVCQTRSHLRSDNPLRHRGSLPMHVAIEIGAQAAGIHGGLLNRELFPGSPAQMGYLAVISNAQWNENSLNSLEDNLIIFARRTAVTPGGRAYRVRIEHRSETIMSADLVIALETGDKVPI
jgi:predicted hotdog family 3-hydroxylacyl-ACP dehydratase